MSERDWAERKLIAWTGMLARHRVRLTVVLLLMGVLFSWMSRGVAWQPDVLQFFSANSDEVKNVRAAAGRPGLATQLRLDVHASAGVNAGDGAVEEAAETLAEKLRAGSGDAGFYQVWTGPGVGEMAAGYGKLVQQAPVLLTPEQQAEIERRANAAFIDGRFADVRNHLADPDGEILLRRLAGDPLGFSEIVTAKMTAISPLHQADAAAGRTDAAGAATAQAPANKTRAVTMENGLLETRDTNGGMHVMLVLEPRSPPSDQAAAERTMAVVDRAIDAVKAEHKGTDVWVVGAHRAYVENAQRITRDVTWVSTAGAAAVALAIGVYFGRRRNGRGWRPGWGEILICMLPPTVGVGLALGLAGMLHLELPLILLGFAGLLSGSTTDYGIQILAACRRIAAEDGVLEAATVPARAARRMLGPISMSVATSVTGFAALGLSEAPGLQAMGLFVAAATVCIWVVTFMVLPAYVGLLKTQSTETPREEIRNSKPEMRGAASGARKPGLWWSLGAAAFLGVTCWLAWAALHVRFDTNPRALDGASAEMRSEELAFYGVWGDFRNRAVVQVRAADANQALTELHAVHAYLADQKRDGLIEGLVSPAELLPDQATVDARAAQWRAYWTDDRRAALRSLLNDAARANGMRPDTFVAYADRIANLNIPPADQRLRDSPAALFPGLIQWDTRDGTPATTTPTAPTATAATPAGGPVTISSIIAMNRDTSLRLATGWGPELRLRFPDVTILSGNMLIFDAIERSRAEGERLGPWCLLAILIPLWIYFRRLRSAWLVMTCLVVGFIWVLGAAHVFGNGLNLLSLMPILFTLGVAVDYGIYRGSEGKARNARFAAQSDGQESRGGPTFLCALTTILGSGSLALAAHPALRWLGITLVAGVVGGYLTSLFVVGPLTRRRMLQAASPENPEIPGNPGPPPARFWRWLTDWPAPAAAAVPAAKLWRVSRGLGRNALRLALALLTFLLIVPVWAQWRLAREIPAGIANAPAPPMPPVALHGDRNYVTGQSWMRWRDGGRDNGLWEIMLAGNTRQRGFATAKLAGPIDLRIENEMLDQLDYFLPQAWSRWLVLRGMGVDMVSLPQYVSEEDQEEIYWAAHYHKDVHDYLSPTYPRILSYHALHDISQMLIDNPLIVPNTFACTGVVSLPAYTGPGGDGASASGGETAGHLLLARVFDFEGGDSFGRQKSITYVVPDEPGAIPFAHVAWPGLSGAVTGINRERIALFINAAATSDFRRIGTPTILMARDVLEHAHTLAQAEAIIRRTQVFVSDIIVVADGKTGAANVFEKSPDRTAVYAVKDSAVVANHLVTPEFANDPVNRGRAEEGTTTQRYARARQLLDGMAHQVTPESLAALVRDKKGLDGKSIGLGNRNAIDGLIACHAVVMDVTTGQMWVAAWPYAEGKFIGVDVLKTLEQGPGNFQVDAPASPPFIGEDSMMAAGSGGGASAWQRVQASRVAARDAEAALAHGTLERALALAEEAIRANGDFYLGHELRGRALLKRGDFAGAKAALQEALRLDPPYAKRRAAIEGLIKQCDIR